MMDKQIYNRLIDWAVNHSGLNSYDKFYGEFLLNQKVLIFPLSLFILFLLAALTIFFIDRCEKASDEKNRNKFDILSLGSFIVAVITAITFAFGSFETNSAKVDTSSLHLSKVYQSLSPNQQIYLTSKLDEYFLKQIGEQSFPNDYRSDKLVKIDYSDFKNIAKDVAYVAGDDVLIKEYFEKDAILRDNYERIKSLYEKRSR